MKLEFLYLFELICISIGFSLMFLINIWPRSFFIQSISDCSFYLKIKHISYGYTGNWDEANDIALISTLIVAAALMIFFFFRRHHYLSGFHFARVQILKFISVLKR